PTRFLSGPDRGEAQGELARRDVNPAQTVIGDILPHLARGQRLRIPEDGQGRVQLKLALAGEVPPRLEVEAPDAVGQAPPVGHVDPVGGRLPRIAEGALGPDLALAEIVYVLPRLGTGRAYRHRVRRDGSPAQP